MQYCGETLPETALSGRVNCGHALLTTAVIMTLLTTVLIMILYTNAGIMTLLTTVGVLLAPVGITTLLTTAGVMTILACVWTMNFVTPGSWLSLPVQYLGHDCHDYWIMSLLTCAWVTTQFSIELCLSSPVLGSFLLDPNSSHLALGHDLHYSESLSSTVLGKCFPLPWGQDSPDLCLNHASCYSLGSWLSSPVLASWSHYPRIMTRLAIVLGSRFPLHWDHNTPRLCLDPKCHFSDS